MLIWTDNRWHCDDRPIHAGCGMEVCWPDGTWQRVRIESGDCGRKLFACFDYHGMDLSIRVDENCLASGCGWSSSCDLRWPEKECHNCGTVTKPWEGHSPCNPVLPDLRRENSRLKGERDALQMKRYEVMSRLENLVYLLGDSAELRVNETPAIERLNDIIHS